MALARAPSPPQSMVTKLVAEAIGAKPLARCDVCDPVARGFHPGDHGLKPGLIVKRCKACCLAKPVDAEMIAHPVKPRHRFRLAEHVADRWPARP
jgi:hypothetical protein